MTGPIIMAHPVDLFSTGTCDIKEEVEKLEEIQTQVITESNIIEHTFKRFKIEYDR